MTKPTKGVKVVLDRERYLRYPLSIVSDLDEIGKLGAGALGRILHLGLKRDDPELTQEQVEDMVDLQMLRELVEPIKEATGGLVDMQKLYDAVELGDVEEPEKKGS